MVNRIANAVLMSSPQPGQSSFTQLIPLLLIMVVFYFFLIRPQMKKQKEMKNFRESLKKGDRIITAGGIYGKINNISGNIVTVDVGNNVLLKVDKSGIMRDTTDVDAQQQQ